MDKEPVRVKKSKKMRNDDKIQIKNAKDLFRDINTGAQEVVVDYNQRKQFPNKYKMSFKKRIFEKLDSHVILGKKYENAEKKKGFKKYMKLFVYVILSITIIAVTNIVLLEKFSSAITEYMNETPDIKNKKILEIMSQIIKKFVEKMKTLSTLQQLLVGTVFANTIVNQIPMAFKRADTSTDAKFLDMFKDIFKNLISVESKVGR